MFDLLRTISRRRLLFAALYFSEGAPIGFLWWYLPTKLRASGVPIEQVTALTAALVIPWTLKFLWAPAIDTWRGKRWSFREWGLTAQAGMIAFLVPLFWLGGPEAIQTVTVLLLLHAVAAATQDVAIDALAIEASNAGERGTLNGWMQAGMLLGRSLFGGVALILDAALGFHAVLAALLVAIAVSGIALLGAHELPAAPARERRFWRTLRSAAGDRSTWLGLGFALLGGAGFEAVGAVAGPFLIDRGVSQAGVGTFLAFPSVGAMLLGALLGGRLADRSGALRASLLGVAGLAVLIAATAAATGGSAPLLFTLLGTVYLGIGVLTAASYALFMDLTRPELGATQFSAFMAATNACEAWATFSVGRMAGALSYGPAFLAMAGASLLSLPLLLWLRREPVLRKQGAGGLGPFDKAVSG